MSAAADEGHQKSPEEIRLDIEQTREELGDTVQALAAKTDVKGQAKQRIASLKDSAQTRKDEFASRAKDATPESAGAGAQQITSTVKNRPVPFAALGAFACGVVVGWLIHRR